MASSRKLRAKRQPIVVIGGGGHAKVVLGLLSRLREYDVLGYVDPRDNGPQLGYPRLGGDEVLPSLAKKRGVAAAIGVGKVKSGRSRLKIVAGLKELGFSLPSLVALSAVVARGSALADGSIVMDGAVVQPGCAIGVAAILNSGCVVDHDCVLGDDVHIAPGAVLSGNVSVGDGGMVGAGATLIQGIRVAADCTIGAGATVTSDCLEAGTYVGVPARRVGP